MELQRIHTVELSYEEAKALFLGKRVKGKRLNCAEIVSLLFARELEETGLTANDFKKFGHGKAPGGMCGILYAGKIILEKAGRTEKIDDLESMFISIAGTVKCKELKKRQLPFCAECIEKTARHIRDEFEKNAAGE